MSISITVNDVKDIATITIVGSFDFSLFNEFRAGYSDLNKPYKTYVVDMSMVEYFR